MRLWNKKPLKNYGVKISESVLVILCSILKGENEITDRINKEKASKIASSTADSSLIATSVPSIVSVASASTESSAVIHLPSPLPAAPTEVLAHTNTVVGHPSSVSSVPAPDQPISSTSNTTTTPGVSTTSVSTVNAGPADLSVAIANLPISSSLSESPSYLFLQPLLDMGFPQDRCLEAITQTSSLEQATEYLLNNASGTQVSQLVVLFFFFCYSYFLVCAHEILFYILYSILST